MEVAGDLVPDEVDARVVEVAADRVLPVEGLDRPRVRGEVPHAGVAATGGREGERDDGAEEEDGATHVAPSIADAPYASRGTACGAVLRDTGFAGVPV